MTAVLSFTRADGRVVTLHEAWRVEVRTAEGELVEAPMEWLREHENAARLIYARKCAEPVRFDDELVADVRALVARVRLGRVEREAVEDALLRGRPTLLRNLVRGFASRAGGSGARSIETRITAAQAAAVERLPPELRSGANTVMGVLK